MEDGRTGIQKYRIAVGNQPGSYLGNALFGRLVHARPSRICRADTAVFLNGYSSAPYPGELPGIGQGFYVIPDRSFRYQQQPGNVWYANAWLFAQNIEKPISSFKSGQLLSGVVEICHFLLNSIRK